MTLCVGNCPLCPPVLNLSDRQKCVSIRPIAVNCEENGKSDGPSRAKAFWWGGPSPFWSIPFLGFRFRHFWGVCPSLNTNISAVGSIAI